MGLAERTAGVCSQERLRVQPGLGTAQLLSRQQDCGPALQVFFFGFCFVPWELAPGAQTLRGFCGQLCVEVAVCPLPWLCVVLGAQLPLGVLFAVPGCRVPPRVGAIKLCVL